MYQMDKFHRQRHPDFFTTDWRSRSAIKDLGWQSQTMLSRQNSTIQLLAKIVALPAPKRSPRITIEALDLLLHNLVFHYIDHVMTQYWCILAWLVQSGQIKEDE